MRTVKLALKASAQLGECPRWDEQEALLYWVDINGFCLNRFDPSSGVNTSLQFKEEIGCFSLRSTHGFVLAMRSGFYLLNGWNTELMALSDPESELVNNRFNDGRCDVRGRFIAGSYYPPKDTEAANLWMLESDGQVKQLEKNLLTANGSAFSPDNRYFYLADTPKHVIYRYQYDVDSGCLSDREIFHQFPYGQGRPDGAAVDVEGNYWTALYEGQRIVCLNPNGEIIEEIRVPAMCPTMVAFGDDDFKTLYITTAGERPDPELEKYPDSGSVFKVRVDVSGSPEHRFLG